MNALAAERLLTTPAVSAQHVTSLTKGGASTLSRQLTTRLTRKLTREERVDRVKRHRAYREEMVKGDVLAQVIRRAQELRRIINRRIYDIGREIKVYGSVADAPKRPLHGMEVAALDRKIGFYKELVAFCEAQEKSGG